LQVELGQRQLVGERPGGRSLSPISTRSHGHRMLS
jgi:hypothetical protein